MKTAALNQKKDTMRQYGDSLASIIGYWIPELITSTILYSLTPLVDSYLVGQLGSLTVFGALGMATNFLHTLIKFSESIPAASVAIIGRHNGKQEFAQCGAGLANAFWTTTLIGLSQFVVIFFAAESIFRWIGVPEAMVVVGAPFLILKSLGVFLIFTSLAFVSFIKAIKNTRVPMLINLAGIAAFIFFDYALILGRLGFPQLGITGSAIATIMQYAIINVAAIIYIVGNPEYKKYFSDMFLWLFDWDQTATLLNMSWPIMVDKSAFALSYVWLAKMIAPLGASIIVSYDVVQKLERFAFLPAIAFSQIIVFLISNRLGAQDYEGAVANVKKIWCLTAFFTSLSLITLSYNASYFVSFFDATNQFGMQAVPALQSISLFVIFDLTQIVLAGALRGAGDVRTVMMGRVAAIVFFFIPMSYYVSTLEFTNQVNKFIVIYGTFYFATGIMGLIFMARIYSKKWYQIK